jgi:hypothetical protein
MSEPTRMVPTPEVIAHMVRDVERWLPTFKQAELAIVLGASDDGETFPCGFPPKDLEGESKPREKVGKPRSVTQRERRL